jgi:hypothetical protein
VLVAPATLTINVTEEGWGLPYEGSEVNRISIG